MSSPYGPGGNDPQQWGQQPQQPYGPPSGGFPAQQPGGYPQQPGQQPQYGGYPQQQPTAPYGQPQEQSPYGQPQDPNTPGSGGFPAQQSPYGQQQQQYPGYGQQQQQPYGGGYQQYPGQEPPKKKSGAMLWVIVGVVVLAVAAVGVLGFVTPGFFNKKVLDNKAVQDGVVKILKERYQENATDVSCPADQEVKAGHSFECTLKVDGESRKVTITVKSEDKAEYEVSQSK
ncbi:DUF4333 domain-containing protein [Kibdelosporangium persicum]|uniref:DUF4333 domain-containing protein n=1 Tax=Kibdelosporangium persicum TaxID=2698649 RepID=A0ABX2F849_9PSEU|nr:DUF4333 domain-containing protein [Kibdelosporangium persicum]NRN67497.1 hypothetical protein [Kibdelosporangium persicum]